MIKKSNEFVYTEDVTGEIVNIPISLLHHHHDNPRKDFGDLSELTESIKAKGVLQNLTVVPYWFKTTGKGEDRPDKQAELGYLVVIGNRRLEAAKAAGIETLPCIISEMSQKDQVATMLLENMQRKDLTIYEQAKGFQMMIDFGESLDSVCEKTGFSKSTVRRRLKIAELDSDTLQNVASRQVDIMDYDKLNQIDDLGTRNKVLAEIGTSNFNNALQKAITAQEITRKKEKWREIFTKYGATEIEYSEAWNSEYSNIGYYDKEPDEEYIKKAKDEHDVLYYAFGYKATIYLRTNAKSEESPEQIEENRKREELSQRRRQLEELSERAFELRFSFIKHYSYPNSKKNINKISDWFCLREITSMICQNMFSGAMNAEASRECFKELFDFCDKKDFENVKEFINKHPEKALLMCTYSQWCDSKSKSCYSWDLSFRKNELLTTLYKCLCDLGYEMSDDEKAMINGTHEFYVKDESKEIDTANDEAENVDETDDDALDADLKEMLSEKLEQLV